VAAWLSVMAGALATALQLWLSGTSPLVVVLPAMLGVHLLIGVGEAVITVAALSFIMRARPDILAPAERAPAGPGWMVAAWATALLVLLLAPWASTNPDGLERVAMDLGFIDAGQAAAYELLPDYTIPLLGETTISVVMAGLLGVFVVTAVVLFLIRLIR
jgi:cobalt/nickel transport system permease protein